MRNFKRKYKSPRTSWDSEQIAQRGALEKEFGLRRRKEILIAQEVLRGFRGRARVLINAKDERKRKELLDRLVKLGLLEKGKGLDDVLALTVNNILERRLQTIVWRKGLATTARGARQMIIHGHVTVNSRAVKSPSYMVPTDEEPAVALREQRQGGGERK